MADDKQGMFPVNTAQFLIVDPCVLDQSGAELAALVEQGKALLVGTRMDGTYTASIEQESVGLVVNVDPDDSWIVSPEDAHEALGFVNEN